MKFKRAFFESKVSLTSIFGDKKTEKGAVLNQEALQIMMLELVKQEVEKAMQNYSSKQENVQVEEEIEKQKVSEFVLAPEVAKSVRDAMSAFRNR